MNNETKEEKRLNFSIPTRSIWSVIMLILLGWFVYIQTVWYLIPDFKIIEGLRMSDVSMNHLRLLWSPLILLFLSFLVSLMFIRIFKRLKFLRNWYSSGFLRDVMISIILSFFVSFFGCFFFVSPESETTLIGLFLFITSGSFLLGCIIGIIEELSPEKE